jgi:flagellar motility protein MotE (MotC chaperone)
MIKLLTSNWTTLSVSAIVYLGATAAFWKTPAPASPAQTAAAATNPHAASWEFHNPEADQLSSELHEEKKGLDKRRQDLDELAARLEAEQNEVTAARQEVVLLQTNFDKSVLRVTEDETANLKKLAKVYSAMAPESAAAIFADMDDVAVSKIIVFMKDADTAGILEALSKKGDAEARRAAALSERLRVASVGNNPAK